MTCESMAGKRYVSDSIYLNARHMNDAVEGMFNHETDLEPSERVWWVWSAGRDGPTAPQETRNIREFLILEHTSASSSLNDSLVLTS
jgi:hypothetical protein